jgi:hypothetical protein
MRLNISQLFLIALLPLAPDVFAQTQKFATQFDEADPVVPSAVLKEAKRKPWKQVERGPVAGLVEFARGPWGVVWLGGPNGAARFDPNGKNRWETGARGPAIWRPAEKHR